ncbi:MAG: hypothetical protein ACKO7P_02655 [Bacteroidota bacterium]
MGWAFGSHIQIRINGTVLQELQTNTPTTFENKYKPLFLKCARILDELKSNGVFKCPEGKGLTFFKELTYYLDITSNGIFSLTNDLTFIEVFEKQIFENEGIFSPIDMYKVLLFLNALGNECIDDVWFGLGNHDSCLLFGAFIDKKFVYVKAKKNNSDIEKGNIFVCSKKEMELFFAESYNKWIVNTDLK